MEVPAKWIILLLSIALSPPLDPSDAATDNDGGTLSNADELTIYGTNPNNYGTNPNNPDTDGDGVDDGADAFPNDPTETVNSDGDGVGNNSDAFPNDPSETTDSDGDGLYDTNEPHLAGTRPPLWVWNG